jgi:hypothetical protein
LVAGGYEGQGDGLHWGRVTHEGCKTSKDVADKLIRFSSGKRLKAEDSLETNAGGTVHQRVRDPARKAASQINCDVLRQLGDGHPCVVQRTDQRSRNGVVGTWERGHNQEIDLVLRIESREIARAKLDPALLRRFCDHHLVYQCELRHALALRPCACDSLPTPSYDSTANNTRKTLRSSQSTNNQPG